MKIRKIITLSVSALMLASVGTGISNITPSSVHASKISRLISQRNSDYRRSSYYSRQAERLNNEIKQLSRRSNPKATKEISNHKAYSLGVRDALNYARLTKANFHYYLRKNKAYRNGYIHEATYICTHGLEGYQKVSHTKAHKEAISTFNYVDMRVTNTVKTTPGHKLTKRQRIVFGM